MTITKKDLAVFAFVLFFCSLLLVFSIRQPVRDFGNYYYGSRVWVDKGDASMLYKDIHLFNELIKGYGEKNYFENYIPVPPLSLLFYYPFLFFKPLVAKFIFNILSILVFSFSVTRLFRYFGFNYKYLVSLFVVAFPLYINFVQGQSYLLVAAALIEALIASEQRRYFVAGGLIALIFHLKLYPALILLYFIIKKEYRVVAWASIITGVLFLASFIFVGPGTLQIYWTGVFPRFFRNEIIDPYYYGHQGLDILSRNLFSYDALSNPAPYFNLPLVPAILKSLIYGGIVYCTVILVKKQAGVKAYGFFLFAAMLVSNYVPVYSLLLLVPFILTILDKNNRIFIYVLLFLACNIPLAALGGTPFIIKYERVILFLLLFIYIVFSEQPHIKLLPLLSIVVVIGLITALNYSDKPANYFLSKKHRGVYYNMELQQNNVILWRCLGDKDQTDTITFPEPIVDATTLMSHPLLNSDRQRVRNIYWINNKWLLYLSDLRQGIGMYQPRLQQPR